LSKRERAERVLLADLSNSEGFGQTKSYTLDYKSLGTLLVENRVVSERQLEKALQRQRERGGLLGDILIEMGFASEREVISALARQLNIEHIAAEEVTHIDGELLKLIPERVAKQYMVVPLSAHDNAIDVAMANPFDILAIDDLRALTNSRINTAIISRDGARILIEKFYTTSAREESLEDVLRDVSETHVELKRDTLEDRDVALERLKEQSEAAPIVRLVDYIIANAINERASDIHVEPQEKRINIRYRIDGILHDIISPAKELQMAIVSRIKIMANLDIAERRLPQDGRFTIRIRHREVDLRVSTLPTIFGEKVVMRLLEKGALSLDLEKLGFDDKALEVFKRHITRPHGMILLTGPTGSGKTTTLYSGLSAIKSTEINIVTVEDPVEYQIAGVYQVQANPKIGLTFAMGLRHILRQDPDIIMIGEIRDLETAEMGIRSALTGHLVFSTLHTNDSAGTITRLVNMGIEPFLVASSLNLSAAQRLVRRICPECKESYRPNKVALASLGLPKSNDIVFHRGKGCSMCRGTGYFGRLALCEMLEMKQAIRNLVLNGADGDTIRQTAIELGMVTLRQNGIQKVVDGVTTIEEVMRATMEDD
jgi:type IV pilus assembly protein PilB